MIFFWKILVIVCQVVACEGFAIPSNHISPNVSTTCWQVIESSPNSSWVDVTSSASGQFLAAISYDRIYYSVNKGATWRRSLLFHVYGWSSIASSSTGQLLAAVVIYGGVYLSSDYGLHWKYSENAPSPLYWVDVAMSASGQMVCAADYLGGIWRSGDSGLQWTICAAPTSGNWQSIDLSASGQFVSAVQSGGFIFVSSDYAASWTQATDRRAEWTSIRCSGSGKHLMATATAAKIHLSNNYGSLWTESGSSEERWGAVALSGSGERAVAATDEVRGAIYQSLDFGETWQLTAGPQQLQKNMKQPQQLLQLQQGATERWSALASDASGRRLLASSYGGQLYQNVDA